MKAVLHLSHGFHVRNLLDTELLARMTAAFDVVLVVDPADADACRADYASARVTIDAARSERRNVERTLEFVRRRILVKPRRALTTSVFSDRERRERPFRHAVLRMANSLLGRWRGVRRAWLALEHVLVPGHEFDLLLARHRPDVVVAANYGTEPETIRLLRAAARARVPSATIVPSFDNLTSKGAIAAVADRMLVWNDTMRREAVDLHDVPSERVVACGPLQFDIYASPDRWADARDVWAAHGLDVARPTFVVGTITPVYFPYNVDVITIIAEAIERGNLPADGQVLVRLHPQVVRDRVFGDDLAGYEQLARRFPFVRLNVPAVRKWQTMSPPPKNDMAVLASILAHAAAVVVPASTLAIDAALVGTPVVGIAFDGNDPQPPERSIARHYDFTHYKPVAASGAIDLARSAEELIASLNSAIRNRSLLEQGRQRLIAELVGRFDGRAVDRVVAEIAALAARSSGAPTAD
jgi:hypothetical protein